MNEGEFAKSRCSGSEFLNVLVIVCFFLIRRAPARASGVARAYYMRAYAQSDGDSESVRRGCGARECRFGFGSGSVRTSLYRE
jgi:hypothetical protein